MHGKRLAGGLGTVVGPGLMLTALAVGDTEARQCTLESVQSTYGATFTGAIMAGPFAGPYAGVARPVCDGKGAGHGEGTESLKGTIVLLVD